MIRKLIIAFVALIVVLIVVSFFTLNALVKKGVETFVPKMTQSPVTVESVKLSPFTGKGEISGLVIGNPEGFETDEAFRLGSVKIHIDPMSVMSGEIVIHDIVIDGAEVTYEFKGLTTSNIQQIMDNMKEFGGEQKEKPAGEKKKVKIEHFLFANAKVHLSSTLLKGEKVSTTMPDVELTDIGDQTLAETILDVQEGLWDGLKDSATQLKDQFSTDELEKGVTEGVTEGIKGLLGN